MILKVNAQILVLSLIQKMLQKFTRFIKQLITMVVNRDMDVLVLVLIQIWTIKTKQILEKLLKYLNFFNLMMELGIFHLGCVIQNQKKVLLLF